jgi:hypothetical protein
VGQSYCRIISKVHSPRHYCRQAVLHSTNTVSHAVPCHHHRRSPPSYLRIIQRGILIRHILTDGHPAPSLGRPEYPIPPLRPKTPSHIPVPSRSHFRAISEAPWDDNA